MTYITLDYILCYIPFWLVTAVWLVLVGQRFSSALAAFDSACSKNGCDLLETPDTRGVG